MFNLLLVDEPTFTTLESVRLDLDESAGDHENSSPSLIIDINGEMNCSQSAISDYFPRRERIGECLPRRTFNESNKEHNYLSSNLACFTLDENHPNDIDQIRKEHPCEENR